METARKIIAIMNCTDTPPENSCDDSDVDMHGVVIETKQDSVEKIKAQTMETDKLEPKEQEKQNAETKNNEIQSNQSNNNLSDCGAKKISYKEFGKSDNLSKNTSSVLDVPLNIEVVMGSAKRSIREIMNFKNGTLLELDQLGNQPVELHVNGKVIAYGEAVMVDENLAIHILDINKDNI
jgi:flagellar motor switch protein FliN/FliY